MKLLVKMHFPQTLPPPKVYIFFFYANRFFTFYGKSLETIKTVFETS